jgi:hypothetical protein
MIITIDDHEVQIPKGLRSHGERHWQMAVVDSSDGLLIVDFDAHLPSGPCQWAAICPATAAGFGSIENEDYSVVSMLYVPAADATPVRRGSIAINAIQYGRIAHHGWREVLLVRDLDDKWHVCAGYEVDINGVQVFRTLIDLKKKSAE